MILLMVFIFDLAIKKITGKNLSYQSKEIFIMYYMTNLAFKKLVKTQCEFDLLNLFYNWSVLQETNFTGSIRQIEKLYFHSHPTMLRAIKKLQEYGYLKIEAHTENQHVFDFIIDNENLQLKISQLLTPTKYMQLKRYEALERAIIKKEGLDYVQKIYDEADKITRQKLGYQRRTKKVVKEKEAEEKQKQMTIDDFASEEEKKKVMADIKSLTKKLTK